MGQMILDRVIALLSNGGIRADYAYPPERITRVEEPVAVVSLEKADLAERTATVLVEILAPKESGGGICQRKALNACALLEEDGAECSQGACEFLSKGNLFRVPVKAKFRGAVRAYSTEEVPKATITTGTLPLRYACGFFAEQERRASTTTLATAPWEFTIEEFFPWGIEDSLEAGEPFDVDVTCMGLVERFEECKWIYRKRIAEDLGIRQVRRGEAQRRILTSG